MGLDPGKTAAVSRRGRFVAFLLLASFLVLVTAGPAHIGHDSLSDHDVDRCATCAALIVISTALVVFEVLLLLVRELAARPETPPPSHPVVTVRGLRIASPRAPPGIA